MFKASAQLEFDIQDASLQQTKRRVESELADISVGGSGGGVSGMLSRDVRSAASGGGTASTSIQAAQLEQLEDINDTLEKIAPSVSGDGGGGGLLPTLGLVSLASGGGSGGLLAGLASTLASGASAAARRGGPSVLFSGEFGNREIGRDGSGIGPGARALSSAAEDAGRSMGLPDVGGMQIDIGVPEWLRDVELSVPSFLQDLMVKVPSVLQDLQVSVPPALRDLSVSVPPALRDLRVGVPPVLRDPPDIDVALPPALQGLLGTDGAGSTPTQINPNRPREGGDVRLLNRAGERQRGSPFSFDIRIQHDFQNVVREIEDVLRGELLNSPVLEDRIKQVLERQFPNAV